MRVAAAAASSAESTSSSAGTGMPCRASSALDSASERVANSADPLDVGLDRLAALVEPALAPGVADHGVEVRLPPGRNPAGGQAAHGADVDQRVAGREEPADVGR